MTGDKKFILVKDFDKKAWRGLSTQQDEEMQGKEEVEQGQFQPGKTWLWRKVTQKTEWKRSSCTQATSVQTRDCSLTRDQKVPKIYRAVDSLIAIGVACV